MLQAVRIPAAGGLFQAYQWETLRRGDLWSPAGFNIVIGL